MPKVLVAISSCQSFEASGLNDPMRETWLTALPQGWGYKFFHGRGAQSKHDVVVLDVDDGMGGLTEKAKAKARWAIANEYDYIFSCFPDTYANAERLAATGFENYDYMGNVYKFPNANSYFCQGGPGYFMSRKACVYLVNNTMSYLNDDTFIGDTLNRADILRCDDRRFTMCGPGPLKTNESVTNHLSTQPGGFTGQNMREEHKRWLESLSESPSSALLI